MQEFAEVQIHFQHVSQADIDSGAPDKITVSPLLLMSRPQAQDHTRISQDSHAATNAYVRRSVLRRLDAARARWR